MFFKVTMFFIVLNLFSVQGYSKCCDSLHSQISGNGIQQTLNLILETIEAKYENIRLSIDLLNKDLRNIQQQLQDLNETICIKEEETTTTMAATTTEPTTKSPQSLPTNCAEALKNSGQSGVYEIMIPNSRLGPFKVYCLQTVAMNESVAGNWLIVQRRQDGSVGFYRDWSTYQRGFGDMEGEFFIGLDKLYALTKSKLHELWVQLKDFDGGQRWARYSDFRIGGESEKYALNSLGTYSGDAGDAIILNIGRKWSTFDAWNGNYTNGNCAVRRRGAWWYSYNTPAKEGCTDSNLNGLYLQSDQDTLADTIWQHSICWRQFRGYSYSNKYVHMAIRPV